MRRGRGRSGIRSAAPAPSGGSRPRSRERSSASTRSWAAPTATRISRTMCGWRATRAMTNIRNHLSVDPTAKIVVVAHGRGIDFLLKEAKTPSGSPFVTDIDELALRGVEFRICRFTLERRNIESSRVVPDAKIVPSGVAEVARLQSVEHYSYLKP